MRIKPEMAIVVGRLGDQLISLSLKDDSAIYAYWQQSGASGSTIVVPTKRTRELLVRSGTPVFLLIDSAGIVRHAQIGYSGPQDINDMLGELGDSGAQPPRR